MALVHDSRSPTTEHASWPSTRPPRPAASRSGATALIEERAGDRPARTPSACRRDLVDAAGGARPGARATSTATPSPPGPGSFTGLRVGIATMQGLALVGDRLVDVSARSSCCAHDAARAADAGAGTTIVAWMEAYRGEVFAARYRVDRRRPPIGDVGSRVRGRPRPSTCSTRRRVSAPEPLAPPGPPTARPRHRHRRRRAARRAACSRDASARRGAARAGAAGRHARGAGRGHAAPATRPHARRAALRAASRRRARPRARRRPRRRRDDAGRAMSEAPPLDPRPRRARPRSERHPRGRAASPSPPLDARDVRVGAATHSDVARFYVARSAGVARSSPTAPAG